MENCQQFFRTCSMRHQKMSFKLFSRMQSLTVWWSSIQKFWATSSPSTNDIQSGPCAAGRSCPFVEIIKIISAKMQWRTRCCNEQRHSTFSNSSILLSLNWMLITSFAWSVWRTISWTLTEVLGLCLKTQPLTNGLICHLQEDTWSSQWAHPRCKIYCKYGHSVLHVSCW